MKNLFKLTLLVLAILLPSTATAYDFEVDGIYYNISSSNTVEVTGSFDHGFYYFGDVVIPSTVTYNETTYFVTSIDNNAFFYNQGLASVTIPNSVINISDNAFFYCIGLTSIVVESGNPKYDSRDNCNALIETASNTLIFGCQNTTIPNSVIKISDNAFFYCTGLTSIDIPNSVTSIGSSAFAECWSLTSITIPNTVTSISNGTFYNCSFLSNVTIPDSVTYIGSYAFYGCGSLSSITIPNTVSHIGSYAFADCQSLNEVFSYIYDPLHITMGSYVFSPYHSGRTLYVPKGSFESYQAYYKWSEFFDSIEEMEFEPTAIAESIQLNVTTAGLNEGATLQLTAMVQPEEGTSKKMNWASSNPSIATVDDNGLVTTHSVGTATITAMTTDGSNLSASCTVTLLPVGLKGDVNEDGRLNISDVSDLIDMLLGS